MTAAKIDEARVRSLLEQAEVASTSGQQADANRLLNLARSEAPQHAAVLAASGAQALREGRAIEARTYLEQAIAADGSDPRLFLNLASAQRALGDADAELAALQKALALDPYFFLANFQKASLLERLGDKKLAAQAFHAALSSLRPGSQIPASLQPIIEHAQRCVQSNMQDLESFLSERLRPVRMRHPNEPLDRVDDCLANLMGRKRIYNQQPTFTHFPRLPAVEFFDRKDFPWLGAVEAATGAIREELTRLLETSLEEFAPYVNHPPEAPLNQWRELNHSLRWSTLFLLKEGQRMERNIERCPRTMAALSGAPVADIARRGPTSFFSRLAPATRIPPHTGVTNTRLTVHIPLIIPPGCGFRVGSTVREWIPGTAFIFDDTIEHEAWNPSPDPRIILIFDIWNPLLTPVEREMMSIATTGVAEFYGDSAPRFSNG